jgi:pimeloyl-ACP methyl ester carboxylesterase
MGGQVISLPDGRQLGYSTIGKGKPIIYFHGTASSRLEILLLKDFAYAANLQIIGYDRPGYGLSTFQRRENLENFVIDVNYLTNYLGIERFGLLGWSGGGVFALAYMSYFPERITKAVVVGTPSLPIDVTAAHNTSIARLAIKIPFMAYFGIKMMSHQVLKANNNIEAFLQSREGKQVLHACSKEDLKFFSDPSWMGVLYKSMAEGFRQGNRSVEAVLQEHMIFMKTCGLLFSNKYSGNLFIWHGDDDKTCRVSNAHLIFKRFPSNVNLQIFEGKGHCVMFDNLEKLGEILCSD